MPDPTALPLIVEDLSFRYRDQEHEALRDVNFIAEPGQIILIAGSSGSGKTTLMRCINGLIPHSYKGGERRGRIWIYNQDPAQQPLVKTSHHVGTVLQNPEKQIVASYVANEIAFGLENAGVPRPEMNRRIDEILAELGLSHLRDRETHSLSGGEKQKVAVGGVLIMEPSILLLDEPLANLDPFSLKEALALIKELAEAGKTILIVEHRVEDVLKINPDKVLFLKEGRQEYFGDVAGFARLADPHEVKLPAELMLARLKADPAFVPAEPMSIRLHGVPEDDEAPLVQFANVSFWYERDKPVLHDVSLAINSGDVIAILGPNGAGKTTLVKHTIGLLRPKSGQVLVQGKDTNRISVASVAKTLGYVFQSPSHMLFAPTVREELAFGPRNLGIPEAQIKENVAAALKMVDLEEKVDEPPLALSFGQQKRVTIAAVVAMQSSILMMDEPTAGQDYRHYMEFMDGILNPAPDSPWHETFKAVLFITHDIDLAVTYANRVIIVSDGRIAADGPPHEVLVDYDLLQRSRLTPSSLLALNRQHLAETGRFLRAEALAPYVNGA
ncbi:MAG: ABC transporter ATP-binding protein [Anaerolineales bacterium]|nr:ABC transporter ATP-binding protein [Anaerolineales bacterium]